MIILYLLKRAVVSLFFIFAVIILNFTIFHAGPGDPTNQYFSPKVDKAQIEQMRNEMGYNLSYHKQLANWLKNIAQGNLGYSWSEHRPVSDVLAEAIPPTLQLTGLALLFNLSLGLFFGSILGKHPHTLSGKIINFTTILVYSVPVFFLALIFIYVFSVKLQLLPASGMQSLYLLDASIKTTVVDRLKHLLLPSLVLGLVGAAVTARFFGEKLQTVLNQDYIKTAQAKGLGASYIYRRHAVKNALLPFITLVGLHIPVLLSGAFIVEVIFGRPGMGRVTFDAMFAKDFPIIMAINLIAAIMVILGNMFADWGYKLADPRIRIAKSI